MARPHGLVPLPLAVGVGVGVLRLHHCDWSCRTHPEARQMRQDAGGFLGGGSSSPVLLTPHSDQYLSNAMSKSSVFDIY